MLASLIFQEASNITLSPDEQQEWLTRICGSSPTQKAISGVYNPDLSFYYDWLSYYRGRATYIWGRRYKNLTFGQLLDVHKIIYENIDQPREQLLEQVSLELESISQGTAALKPSINISTAVQPQIAALIATQTPTPPNLNSQGQSSAHIAANQPTTVQTNRINNPANSAPTSTNHISVPVQSPLASVPIPQTPTSQLGRIQSSPTQTNTAQNSPSPTVQTCVTQSTPTPTDTTSNYPAEKLVEFIVRLSFLISIKICESKNSAARTRSAPFLKHQTLRDVLKKSQPKSASSQPSHREVSSPWHEFPPWLNVVDWERATGMRIEFTKLLNEHLTISRNTLHIFDNVEILNQLKGSKIHADVFSEQFIDETIESVLLFFPEIPNRSYSKWFKKKNIDNTEWKRGIINEAYRDTRIRTVADYPIWGQRLVIIAKASKPQGRFSLRRLYYDNRDEAIWWTRWAVITAVFLALVFGLIQSVTGIVQAVGS